MVHNGVEYALMEAYGEGYELLAAAHLDIDVPATLEVWRRGSVARFASRQDDSPAMRAVATLRTQFGGHAVQTS